MLVWQGQHAACDDGGREPGGRAALVLERGCRLLHWQGEWEYVAQWLVYCCNMRCVHQRCVRILLAWCLHGAYIRPSLAPGNLLVHRDGHLSSILLTTGPPAPNAQLQAVLQAWCCTGVHAALHMAPSMVGLATLLAAGIQQAVQVGVLGGVLHV